MRCGEDGTDCAVKHVVPLLDGHCTKSRRIGSRSIPYEWSCRCPACGRDDKLTLTAKGRNLLRHCQRCKVPQDELTAALGTLLPGCFRPAGKPAPKGSWTSAEDVISLALAGMPPMSLRLALLELAGLRTPDALDRLGVRRENRSRVINGRVRRR